MTKQIWAVSSGDYSDYTVRYICDTEERANTLRVALEGAGYHGAYVEDFEYVDADFDSGIALEMSARVDILTGEVTAPSEKEEAWVVSPPDRAAFWSRLLGSPWGTLTVTGGDHTWVRKVFSERLVQIASDPLFRSNVRFTRF